MFVGYCFFVVGILVVRFMCLFDCLVVVCCLFFCRVSCVVCGVWFVDCCLLFVVCCSVLMFGRVFMYLFICSFVCCLFLVVLSCVVR